jgi:hypothetical protein
MQARAFSKGLMSKALLLAESQENVGKSFGDIQAVILKFSRDD